MERYKIAAASLVTAGVKLRSYYEKRRAETGAAPRRVARCNRGRLNLSPLMGISSVAAINYFSDSIAESVGRG